MLRWWCGSPRRHCTYGALTSHISLSSPFHTLALQTDMSFLPPSNYPCSLIIWCQPKAGSPVIRWWLSLRKTCFLTNSEATKTTARDSCIKEDKCCRRPWMVTHGNSALLPGCVGSCLKPPYLTAAAIKGCSLARQDSLFDLALSGGLWMRV